MKNLTLPIRFGIVTSGILMAYFLILSLMGKHTNVFFSLFNGVITGLGIYETIKYTKLRLGKDFNYGKGFTAGITMGFVATLVVYDFLCLLRHRVKLRIPKRTFRSMGQGLCEF